jgi:type I restriction enzyme S subunit
VITGYLGELCEINVGRTPARADPSFWGVGNRWLSIADMNQGLAIAETKEQITDAGARGARLVEPGTVLLSFKLSIGKVGIAEVPLYTNEAIAALPVKDDRVLDPRYLMRALQAMDLPASANRAAMGVTLNKKSLSQVRIPLVGLPEQRRIAAVLDHADGLRVKRRRVLAHLGSLNHAIFQDSLESVKHCATLREMGIDFISGKNVLGSDLDAHPRNRVIKVSAISGGTFVEQESKPMPSDYVPPEAHRLRQGDILFGRASGSLALLGATAVVSSEPKDLFLPDKIWRMEVRESAKVVPEFALGLLRSKQVRAYIRHNSSGAAGVRNIGKAKLLECVAPLPSLEVQARYVSRARYIGGQSRSVQLTARLEEELFASLQARAFQGEL